MSSRFGFFALSRVNLGEKDALKATAFSGEWRVRQYKFHGLERWETVNNRNIVLRAEAALGLCQLGAEDGFGHRPRLAS